MATYKVRYKTGVEWTAKSKSLHGAKIEATRYAAPGFGAIYITEGEYSDSCSDPVAVKFESDNTWTIPGC